MAVTVDTSGQKSAIANGAGSSFTVGANNNRILIVAFQSGAATSVSGTYGGQALTALDTNSVNGSSEDGTFGTFYLVAPPTGSNSLVFSYTGANNWYANYYSLYEAVQSAPAHAVGTEGTATSTASLTASGGEYGIGLAGSGFTVPTGYSLSGDASSNQLSLNQWFTGDTNGAVAAGSRTAVSNYSSGTSNVQAFLVLVSPTASGPSNMKTWDGLATASVKTMDGLAIASVKTWNGLT